MDGRTRRKNKNMGKVTRIISGRKSSKSELFSGTFGHVKVSEIMWKYCEIMSGWADEMSKKIRFFEIGDFLNLIALRGITTEFYEF